MRKYLSIHLLTKSLNELVQGYQLYLKKNIIFTNLQWNLVNASQLQSNYFLHFYISMFFSCPLPLYMSLVMSGFFYVDFFSSSICTIVLRQNQILLYRNFLYLEIYFPRPTKKNSERREEKRSYENPSFRSQSKDKITKQHIRVGVQAVK